MKKVVHHCYTVSRHLVLYTAISLIILTVLWSILRSSLFYLNNFKPELELWLSENIGQRVVIGAVDTELYGSGLRFGLKNIKVLVPNSMDKVAFEIKKLVAQSSFIAFMKQNFLPSFIQVYGLRIDLSSIKIDFEQASVSNLEDNVVLVWLLSQKQLQLVDSQILLGDFVLNNLNLVLKNQENQHQLQLSAKLPTSIGEKFSLISQFQGEVLQPEQWQGKVYANIQQVMLNVENNVFAAKAKLDLDLWGWFDPNQTNHWQGQVNLTEIQSSINPEIMMPSLKMEFVTKVNAKQWLVNVYKDKYQQHIATIIHHHQQFKAGFSPLNISQWRAWFPVFSKTYADLLAKAQPQGMIRNLQFEQQQQQWFVKADLQQVSSQSFGKSPGVNNLNASILATSEQGMIRLNSKHLNFDYPALFRQPLLLDKVLGVVKWQLVNKGWQLSTPELLISNQDIQTKTQLALDFSQAQPFLDINTYFKQGVIAHTGKYLPTGIMNKNLVKWLDRALVSGKLLQGQFRLLGYAKDFPYDQADGVFYVDFDIDDVVLDYQANWPELKQLNAKVLFQQNSLKITATKGYILQGSAKHILAEIDSLRPTSPLKLKTRITGDIRSSVEFLKQSPLKHYFGKYLQGVVASGKHDLDLKLKLPFNHHPSQVKGNIQLYTNQLQLPMLPSRLDKIQGQINFTESSIDAHQLQAYFAEQAIAIKIKTSRKQTLIVATGNIPIATIKQLYPQSRQWLKPLSGLLDYQAKIKMLDTPDPTNIPVAIELNSNLSKVAIDLPSPFNKTIAQDKSLHFLADITNKQQQFKFQYPQLDVILLRDNTGLKGEIALGEQLAKLPDTGLYLVGHQEKLRLADWLNFFSKLDINIKSDHAFNHLKNPVQLNRVDLKIDQLDILGLLLDQAELKLKQEADKASKYYQIKSQQLDGIIRLVKPNMLVAKINHWHWQSPDNILADSNDKIDLNPEDIPKLVLTIEDFQFNQLALGKLTLNLTPDANQIKIGLGLLAKNPKEYRIKMNGQWQIKPQANTVKFEGKLVSSKLENMLERFGFSSGIQAKQTDISFHLNWIGSPIDVNLAKLSGDIKNITINQGRFIKVEPGLGRALGLFSLDSLVNRRLKLDVSDVVTAGLSFDTITGAMLIEEGGLIYIKQNQPLRIDGPNVSIEIKGKTNVLEKNYDQTILVIPKLTASVPVTATVAGGPAVGAAAFVLQQVFGDQFDKISGYSYRVTGSWENPHIEKQPLFTKFLKEKMPKNLGNSENSENSE